MGGGGEGEWGVEGGLRRGEGESKDGWKRGDVGWRGGGGGEGITLGGASTAGQGTNDLNCDEVYAGGYFCGDCWTYDWKFRWVKVL